ncbi:hypothetical protein DFJ77DRAFT_550323 [Powellomyces hirtus]|nr:hypothetical protein DFJ77DRAFT_550323 [Powellomyces hirtus]
MTVHGLPRYRSLVDSLDLLMRCWVPVGLCQYLTRHYSTRITLTEALASLYATLMSLTELEVDSVRYKLSCEEIATGGGPGSSAPIPSRIETLAVNANTFCGSNTTVPTDTVYTPDIPAIESYVQRSRADAGPGGGTDPVDKEDPSNGTVLGLALRQELKPRYPRDTSITSVRGTQRGSVSFANKSDLDGDMLNGARWCYDRETSCTWSLQRRLLTMLKRWQYKEIYRLKHISAYTVIYFTEAVSELYHHFQQLEAVQIGGRACALIPAEIVNQEIVIGHFDFESTHQKRKDEEMLQNDTEQPRMALATGCSKHEQDLLDLVAHTQLQEDQITSLQQSLIIAEGHIQSLRRANEASQQQHLAGN